MAVALDEIVPFGRSLAEYRLMFNLTESDLNQKILDCGGGPASFNAELTSQGKSVMSIDPIYQFSAAQIRQRFDACVDDIIGQVKATKDEWIWDFHQDPERLRQNRVEAIARFTQDFETGFKEQRYCRAELPSLPFQDGSFDLALCSHLLFLYSDLLPLDFHLKSIIELCRLAREVRLFPLRTLASELSPYLGPVRKRLEEQGIQSEIVPVPYEFQKGGNQMLRIRRGS